MLRQDDVDVRRKLADVVSLADVVRPISLLSQRVVGVESFHWNQNYMTGLGMVDDQHQELVRLINSFGDLLAENVVEFQDLEELFTKLASYAVYHFNEEEGMMKTIGIDQRHLDHHLDEHQRFLDDVASMQKGLSPETPNVASNLLSFLTHWLAYHILGLDRDMAEQVKAIEQGMNSGTAFDSMEHARDNATEPLLVALNGLFEQVSARNMELVQLNQSLEAKVAERTGALSDANDRLRTMANTDVLTGLPNRRHVLNDFDDLWKESARSHKPISCIMIDADHFKEMNDSYGHDAGDQVLRALAKTLQHAVRTDDVVSRLGGDEFFVLCPNTDKEGGLILAEHLRKTVAELRVATEGGGCWHGSISVGLAVQSPQMDGYEDLLKAADASVYAAKRAGKNCVRTVS